MASVPVHTIPLMHPCMADVVGGWWGWSWQAWVAGDGHGCGWSGRAWVRGREGGQAGMGAWAEGHVCVHAQA